MKKTIEKKSTMRMKTEDKQPYNNGDDQNQPRLNNYIPQIQGLRT